MSVMLELSLFGTLHHVFGQPFKFDNSKYHDTSTETILRNVHNNSNSKNGSI